MKSKLIFWLNFLWACLTAFSFPVCLGLTYLWITGHAKGYGYDLGSEADVSVMMGCLMLLVWLILAMPSNIYAFKKVRAKGTFYVIILAVAFLLLAALCIHLLGGWNEFEKAFHP